MWVTNMVNKYEVVNCSKCGKQIPFTDNRMVTDKGKEYYFCVRCAEIILR